MTHCTQGNRSSGTDKPAVQRAIIRNNSLIFYGLAAASFLETAAPLRATLLLDRFAADSQTRDWVEHDWWPAKSMHARETRSYVEAVWPEFDWSSAYAEFYEAYRPAIAAGAAARSLACEALACSAAGAQAAAFYRGLGMASDDGELRLLLHRMSADEAAHFECFRRVFERHDRRERVGLLAAYRTIVSCAAHARDVDVQLAFSRLNASHWYGSTPFAELEYRDFILRMGDVMRRHLTLGPAQRALFRPWRKLKRVRRTPPLPGRRVDRQPVVQQFLQSVFSR